MSHSRLFFAAAAVCVFAAQNARAGDIKVIANSSVGASAITADELKGVFLATKTALSDGSPVEPVVLKEGATRDAFLKEYVGKTESAFETYFRSMVFTGKANMPKATSSDADMVAYVAKTKGAIGYVSSGSATAGVKTLEVK